MWLWDDLGWISCCLDICRICFSLDTLISWSRPEELIIVILAVCELINSILNEKRSEK